MVITDQAPKCLETWSWNNFFHSLGISIYDRAKAWHLVFNKTNQNIFLHLIIILKSSKNVMVEFNKPSHEKTCFQNFSFDINKPAQKLASTVMIISFRTEISGQTVQTQSSLIRFFFASF